MSNIENYNKSYFKQSKAKYDDDFSTKSPISVCQIKMNSYDKGVAMISNLIANSNRDYLMISSTKNEYGDDEKEHDKYSPAICLKHYDNDDDVIFTFIAKLNGEAYLLTNDSFHGYHMMVELVFGGERNFEYSCKIESTKINSNQGEIIPFINMIDSCGDY